MIKVLVVEGPRELGRKEGSKKKERKEGKGCLASRRPYPSAP
jgi:hypothetical protein